MKKLSIKEVDNRGSTPLHWACYSGSELSMIYLLAWIKKEDLSLKDDDGYTALHLAVKSADELETSRPVKTLVFKEARTDVYDNNNKSPLDVL